MKGLFLAVVLFLSYTVWCIGLLRKSPSRNKFKLLLTSYLVFALLQPFLYFLLPQNLGFLPELLLERNRLADFINGVVLYHFFFWFFTVQTYSLASRGFSLEMLISIQESAHHRLDQQGMMVSFGNGKGVYWNFQDKLKDCLKTGLVRFEQGEGRYYNTKGGLLLAVVCEGFKKFLKLGPGG